MIEIEKEQQKIIEELANDRHDLINECDALKDTVFTLTSGIKALQEMVGKQSMNDARLWGVYNKLCELVPIEQCMHQDSNGNFTVVIDGELERCTQCGFVGD